MSVMVLLSHPIKSPGLLHTVSLNPPNVCGSGRGGQATLYPIVITDDNVSLFPYTSVRSNLKQAFIKYWTSGGALAKPVFGFLENVHESQRL